MLHILRRIQSSVLLPFWPNEPFSDEWSRGRKGIWAERAVARALWLRGYGIRAHRWIGPGRTDIDLIAANSEHLLFAEVKLRSPEDQDPWAEVFDTKRQERLRRAIGEYLRRVDQRRSDICVHAFLVLPEATDPQRPRIMLVRDSISPSSVPGWRGGSSEAPRNASVPTDF